MVTIGAGCILWYKEEESLQKQWRFKNKCVGTSAAPWYNVAMLRQRWRGVRATTQRGEFGFEIKYCITITETRCTLQNHRSMHKTHPNMIESSGNARSSPSSDTSNGKMIHECASSEASDRAASWDNFPGTNLQKRHEAAYFSLEKKRNNTVQQCTFQPLPQCWYHGHNLWE